MKSAIVVFLALVVVAASWFYIGRMHSMYYCPQMLHCYTADWLYAELVERVDYDAHRFDFLTFKSAPSTVRWLSIADAKADAEVDISSVYLVEFHGDYSCEKITKDQITCTFNGNL